MWADLGVEWDGGGGGGGVTSKGGYRGTIQAGSLLSKLLAIYNDNCTRIGTLVVLEGHS